MDTRVPIPFIFFFIYLASHPLTDPPPNHPNHDNHDRWLPYELRQRFKHANIGWFLHTPFPSSEIYRILPVRKALLEALLAADLLGACVYRWIFSFLHMHKSTISRRLVPTHNHTSIHTYLSIPTTGFHTYDYARHFLSACGRVLEVDTTPRGLEYASHFMSLGTCIFIISPYGISIHV